MKFFAAVVLAFVIPVVALADEDYEATDAAKTWVALLDRGNYAQSWNAASTLFRGHISQAEWESAAQSARGSMGSVVTRNVAGVDFATTLPGAPDGQYAVIRFNTSFANKAAAIETVTMMMNGGVWKAAGYYVR